MSEQKKIKQLEEENRRLKDAIGALTEAVNVFTQSVESIGICDASRYTFRKGTEYVRTGNPNSVKSIWCKT